jgi:desulfoferrodoxin (superoxide reductase-like protein)
LSADILELFAGNHVTRIATPGGTIKYWADTNHHFPDWIILYLDGDPDGKEELWRLEFLPELVNSEPKNTFELGWAEVGAVSPTWDYIGKWIQTCTSSHRR